MDTTRTIFNACIASLLLIATASAQTIYKQVDDEGRVVFTDQPTPGLRTLATIEPSRPRSQPPALENADSVLRAEPTWSSEPARRVFAEQREPTRQRESTRRVVSETQIGSGAPVTAEPRTEITIRRSSEMAGVGPQALEPATRGNVGDVERAVATYSVLNSPIAAQADAVEAARRARLGATKDTVGPKLVVHASPREHEPVIKNSGMNSMYFIWAATFFALAAGLLYVGWQVFRLILGTAFPRWNVGVA